jgi:PAS domain S-box-containing protein
MQVIPTDTDRADADIGNWSDSLLWFFLSLVIGLGATGALFWHYVAVDRAAVHAQLRRGVESLASFATQASPLEAIQRMFDSVTGPQAELHGGLPLSAGLLQRHLPPDPAALNFDAVSLAYLPRVTAGTVDQYSAQLGSSESAGFPIVERAANGAINRAAPRAEYFPVLLGTASASQYLPLTGLDYAADTMQRLAMLQARDSGQVTMLTQFPMEAEGTDPLIAHYYLAVYESGTTPATPEARRAEFAGLLVAVSYQNSEDLFTLLSSTMQGIEAAYFPDSPLFDTDPGYADVRELVANDAVAIARYNIPGQRFMVAGRASPRLADVLATNTRWWALGIGLLLTAWFASMALWFRNQAKRIKALVIMRTRDLTERTAALAEVNEALSRSEGRYRMLADNASDVIYTCDLEGRYTYVSPSIEIQRGYKPEDLIGRKIADLLSEKESLHVQARYAQMNEAIRANTGKATEAIDNKIEFQGYRKDGSLLWLETTVSLLHDPDGRLAGVLGVSRDISERKRAEKEKDELEEAYRQAQKMEAIGTLAGGIAHDFNNLLTGIYGYADILRSQVGDNAGAHESIDVIEKAATRAKDLTSQLLGFARKGGMEQVIVDLNESVLEVIALLARTINSNITIQRQLSTRKPTVLGDSGQLAHLLLNLGINARDAMPDGGTLTFTVTIDELDEQFCRGHADLQPGTYCEIRVTDTGIGMDKAKMARIFEPFYTDKARGKGTGLGLAMVYGIARSHGGIVTVESQPGRGTTFHVYIPFRMAAVQ